MRILFDTNVLFAAFVSHGTCAGLYEECLWRARIVVSRDILRELEEKLISKARLTRTDARAAVRAVRADAEVAPSAPPLPEPVCRDPDDDLILSAAVSAEADAIGTGDGDLLVLGRFRGIPIFNPRDCLAALRAT